MFTVSGVTQEKVTQCENFSKTLLEGTVPKKTSFRTSDSLVPTQGQDKVLV